MCKLQRQPQLRRLPVCSKHVPGVLWGSDLHYCSSRMEPSPSRRRRKGSAACE